MVMGLNITQYSALDFHIMQSDLNRAEVTRFARQYPTVSVDEIVAELNLDKSDFTDNDWNAIHQL